MMGNQTDNEKALENAWERSLEDIRRGVNDAKTVFDYVFKQAYRNGMAVGKEKAKAQDDNVLGHIAEATEKAGKEVCFPTRAQIAAMAMQGLLNANTVEEFALKIKPSFIAKAAVEYADALIAELGKEGAE